MTKNDTPKAEYLSLFDGVYEEKDFANNDISVVNAVFQDPMKCRWEELFNGFDEMFAITYSSGIDFVSKVVSRFRYAEIIFGHEKVLGSDISTVISVSKLSVEKIAKHKSAVKLAELMEQEKLALFVARDTKSHEKIYCLRSSDGRYRVIVGSANLSSSAFQGLQRENIVCFEGIEAFEYYKELFDDYKEECSDNVSYKVIERVAEDPEHLEGNPREIPVIKTLETKRAIILDPLPKEEGDDVQFVADVRNISKDLKPILPVVKKQGKYIAVKPDIISEAVRRTKSLFSEKREQQKLFPKLHIDYNEQKILFNNKEILPAPEHLRGDVDNVIAFLEGLSIFNGDWKGAQDCYFKFLVWYFVSPFMAKLRQTASRTGNVDVLEFPVVGILYGDSNGGKSNFIELLEKLMTGHRIKPNSNEDFAARNMSRLRQECEGVPIYIDDLSKAQYLNNSEKIIKSDSWGIDERMINYPAIVFSINQLPAIKKDIYKRAVINKITAKISIEEGRKNERKVKKLIRTSTTALFAEFAHRMFQIIAQIEEQMKNDEEILDIFQESSKVLLDIIKESGIEQLPPYMRELSHTDYFGASAIGRDAKQRFLNTWETEAKSFKVDKRRNKLIYTFPEGTNYSIRNIVEELPVELNCQVSQATLTMDYSEAKKFFDCDFKRKLFKR